MGQFIKQIYNKPKKVQNLLFIDRDGTINKKVSYLHKKEDIEILPTVIDGIQLLNQHNVAVVVITNQPVIARGLVTIQRLKDINDVIRDRLQNQNAFINAIYSCPHHPDADNLAYRKACSCRKPNIEMLQETVKDFQPENILGFIGDSWRDIEAGKSFSIPTLFLDWEKKKVWNEAKPDYICNNFVSAVSLLKL